MNPFRRINILPAFSVIALVAVVMLLSVHTLTSIYQDIGRHITLGHIIWTTHHIPSTNLFSYTAPDFPFINHHWFAEVLLYLGDTAFGLKGLILVKAFLLSLAFGLSLAAAWRPRVAVLAMVVGLVSALILIERTDVRPEVLSFLFLGWFLFVLYRRPHSWLLWTLPLVQLLWVNSHIYFFMGPFLILAWWVGQLISSGSSVSWGRRYRLIIIGIALATLCNPWGLKGALYPLRIFTNYGYSIMENKSPFFLHGFGYPQLTSVALYIGIVMVVVSFIINSQHIRRNVFGLSIALVTAVLALMMVRNFPLFALVMMPVILTNLDQAGWHIYRRDILIGGVIVLTLFGASVALGQVYNDAQIGRQFGLIVPRGPIEPVQFYRQAGLHGPMFNNFDIGSFLIWQLPEERVFIDGRPEAYPADFIQNTYIKMQEDVATWNQAVAQYGLNVIVWNDADITPWSQAFVARITKDPQWVAVYHAHDILILVKNTSANAGIITKYRLE